MITMDIRRITSNGNWIPEIDGLRFVAIATTLLAHITAETYFRSGYSFPAQDLLPAAIFIESGGRGVSLFFAISGFILAQPFLRQHLLHKQPVSIKAFFRRRLTRLEPPYILSLLIYAFAIGMTQHRFLSLIPSFLWHIVYLKNFSMKPALNFVTWSLEIEVQFYILAPLLGLLYAIRAATFRRTIMIAMIVASSATEVHMHGILAYNLPGKLQFFMVGFLLADVRATRTKSTISRWWDLVSFVVWVAIFALPSAYLTYTLPGLIFLAYLAAFNGPTTRQMLRTSWVALTGGMCYSFYLMHMLVISIAARVTRRWIIPSNLTLSCVIQFVLLGACIYVFCTAYFVLIERPCMDPNWPRKFAAKVSRLSRSRVAKNAASV